MPPESSPGIRNQGLRQFCLFLNKPKLTEWFPSANLSYHTSYWRSQGHWYSIESLSLQAFVQCLFAFVSTRLSLGPLSLYFQDVRYWLPQAQLNNAFSSWQLRRYRISSCLSIGSAAPLSSKYRMIFGSVFALQTKVRSMKNTLIGP